MTIKLTIPEHLEDAVAGMTERDARLLLMDALAEFVAHRANGNGVAYVEKRYPLNQGGPYDDPTRRLKKMEQVTRRCRQAEALHSADISIELES